jgi:hypothetical protein
MNEMTLIEDMCAAVPAPDEARLATIRARVLGQAVPGEPQPGAAPRHAGHRGTAGAFSLGRGWPGPPPSRSPW